MNQMPANITLPATRPPTLTATVLEQLRAWITDGEIPLGSLLSEKVLADRFGVSKTPVREALAQLQTMGLVEILPQRGGRVFSPDASQVREICEVRIELEGLALRFSMDRNNTKLLSHLSLILQNMEVTFERNEAREYHRLDTAFHNTLFFCCGNRLLHEAYDIFTARISALRTHLSSPHPYLMQRAHEEHRWLVELVRRSDLQSATILLGEHIARTREFHLQTLAVEVN